VNSEDIKYFHNDDQAYKDWLAQHGGYVLTKRSRRGEYMLHRSECTHLRTDNVDLKLTRKPRRWSSRQRILVAWAEQATGTKPPLYKSCM
jgi:hypothetical protein